MLFLSTLQCPDCEVCGGAPLQLGGSGQLMCAMCCPRNTRVTPCNVAHNLPCAHCPGAVPIAHPVCRQLLTVAGTGACVTA